MDPKHITRTSFCDKEIDNVTDNSMKEYILNQMKLKTSISFEKRYAKIYNEKFANNLNNPHIICFKSSGTPYLLFCTQINDTNYCFLIDKKKKDGYEFPKIFIVHYRFDPELFQGTLFEVELIRDKQQEWSLLIGDIYTYKGESLKHIQIHDRMNRCIDIMEQQYKDDSFCNICPMYIKKYFDIQDIHKMIQEFIPQLPYRVRGLYFVPMKTSYSNILYLFTDNDYKQMKQVSTTPTSDVSFRIISTPKPDVYELYLYNEQKTSIQKHSYASIPSIKTSQWMKELINSKEEVFVSCIYHQLFQKWIPVKEASTADTIKDLP